MGNQPDIRAGRLPDSAYAENFSDVHPPLDRKAALVEASRCYFCYDAPCIEACPTGILSPIVEIGRAPSELQSLMRISYAVFCLKKKKKNTQIHNIHQKDTCKETHTNANRTLQ